MEHEVADERWETTRDVPAARGWWRVPALWAFVGAVILAGMYGRVAVANFATGVVGGNSNGYENVWNDYWLRTALQLRRNPFFTDYLFGPNGVSLRFHTLNPFGGLIALPLAPLIGSVGAMNLKFLLALVGAVFFAWLLLRDLTGSPLAAFAGAAVSAYANDQTLAYFSSGAENYLMGSALLPLYLWLLFRTLARARWWPTALGATAALLALALTDWQFTLFAVLITLAYAGSVICTRQAWRGCRVRPVAAVVGRCALIGGVWAAVVFVPLVLPMIREARDAPWLNVSGQATALSRSLVQSFAIGLGNPGYLVLVPVVSGLILLWRRDGARADRRAVFFWLLVAAGGSLLALGPQLKVTPERIVDLPLPYDPLTQLPVFTAGRRPQLFYFVAMLAFGALLAFGLRELFVWLARPGAGGAGAACGRWRRVIPVALVAALLTGTLAPFMVQTGSAQAFALETPPFYRDVLAKDPERYAILELPLFSAARGAAWPAYQIAHGKQLFDGSLSRDHKLENPDIFVKNAPFYRDLFWAGQEQRKEQFRPEKTPDILTPPDYTAFGLPFLSYYNVRYIVLYPAALVQADGDALRDARDLVRQALGASVRPTYEDAIMEVYRVPDAPPAAPPVFVDIGNSGWFPAALSPTKVPYRWADTADGGAAELLLVNLAGARRVTVQMTVQNYVAPRTVAAAINGNPLGAYPLAPRAERTVTLTIDVPPGINKLTLASPEPPVPVQEPGARDNRLLSFGARDVRIEG